MVPNRGKPLDYPFHYHWPLIVLPGTGKEFMHLYLDELINPGLVDKAPGISEWPGDYDTQPQLKSVTMEITSTHYDWYPTGYYLPAGQEATLQVISVTLPSKEA